VSFVPVSAKAGAAGSYTASGRSLTAVWCVGEIGGDGLSSHGITSLGLTEFSCRLEKFSRWHWQPQEALQSAEYGLLPQLVRSGRSCFERLVA